jgi:PAS domain S-box-containing protein
MVGSGRTTDTRVSAWAENRPFCRLFEHSSDALLLVDEEGRCVAANTAAGVLLGQPIDQLPGRSLSDWIQMDDAWPTEGRSLPLENSGQGWLRLGGQGIAYEIDANLFPHQHLVTLRLTGRDRGVDQPLGADGSDPTWQSGPAAGQSWADLTQMMDGLPICIAYVDAAQRYCYVNANYQTWFERSPSNLYGKTVLEVLGQAAYERVRGYVERALQGERVAYEALVPYQDAGERFIHATLVPDVDAQDRVQGYYAVIVDLSDRYQLEQALVASQQKYQTLFEIFPIGISITDAQGQLLEVNPASEQILGISTEEHTHRTYDAPVWQIVHPNGQPMAAADYASVRALTEGRVIQGQVQGIVRPDGHMRWIEVSAAPIPIEGYGVAIAYIDVTERKQTETALQQSKAYYESLATTMPQALFRKDRNLRITYANPAFLTTLNRPLAEVVGKTVHDLYPPDLAERFTAEDQRVLHDGVCLDEVIEVPYDGDACYSQVLKAPLRDEQGVVVGIQGLCWDVTERVRLEQALRASETRLNRILANSVAAIVGVQVYRDRSYRYDFCSAGCELIFGYSPAALQADVSLWWSRVHPEDIQRWVEPSFEDIFAERLSQFEYRFRHADGTWRWLTVSTISQWQPEGQCWYATKVHTDITARKQVEQELDTARQFLQQILDHLPVAVFAKAAQDLRFTLWNPACVELLGYQPGEVLGKTDYDLFAAEQADVCTTQDRLALTTGQLAEIAEEPIMARDGTPRLLHNRKLAVYSSAGEPLFVIGIAEDITARKAAEGALRQREQEFRALSENSPDLIMRCDRHQRFLYVNPKTAELSNLPASAFLGRTSRELGFAEAVVDRWEQVVEQAFVTNQEQSLEYQVVLPMGDRTFYSRVVPECNPTGEPESVLVVVRDVTELKQAQAALTQRAEREYTLRLITQHIRETLDLPVILSTAVQEVQRILNADRTLIFRLDLDRSGVVIQEAVRPPYPVTLDMRWGDECFPPDCYAFYCQGQARIVPDVASDAWGDCLVDFMAETQVRSKIVAPIIQPMTQGEPQVWGLLITHACGERRPWLPEEAELLQQVANQLAIAIQQSELHQRVQQWNQQLEQQVQDRTVDLRRSLDVEAALTRITDKIRSSLDEDQILEAVVVEIGDRLAVECCDVGIYNADRTVTTIAHEFTRSLPSTRGTSFRIQDSQHTDIYPVLFQGTAIQFCDLVPCRKSEQHPYLSVLACPIVDDQGVLGDLWLFRGRTETFCAAEVRLVQQLANQCAIALRQSRLYQAAQAQVLELERLHRLKDDFLSTVSHELRTPMSSIKMATDLLELQLQTLGIVPKDGSLEPASTPISRYLKVLKEEQQREISLITDLLDLTRLDAEVEPLALSSIHLPTWLPYLLEPFIFRAQRRQQTLTYTLDPALPLLVTDIAHLQRILQELLTNASKYTPSGGEIEVSAIAQDQQILLTIANSGVEIPAAERDRIFERFYRIPSHDPWKYGGTGLGLALVHKLVTCLGGTVRVTSEHNQTRFMVELPNVPRAISPGHSDHPPKLQ